MDRPETNTNEPGYDRLMQSHRSLNRLLDEVCEAPDLETLTPLLHQLRLQLAEHFEQEEGPQGFGAALSEAAPHRTEAIQRLFEEHGEFLRSLTEIQEAAKACLKGPAQDVQESARDLCRRIREHEGVENELLTEAMNTDLGGRG